jgi:hypothetical protein
MTNIKSQIRQSILFALFLFISTFSYAQNLDWVKAIYPAGTNQGGNNGKDIAIDDLGNVYTTGVFQYSPQDGPVDFNPGPGVFNFTQSGSFVVKLNAQGNFVWARNFPAVQLVGGSSAEAIAIDNSGNVIIAGYFSGTADLDPGIGTALYMTSGNLDIFVVKLNASGNFLWAKTMPGNSDNKVYDLTIDAQNNFLICGYFQGTVDMDPGADTASLYTPSLNAYITKLTNNGDFIWAKQLGDWSNSTASGIKTDSIGQVYVTGIFGAIDFDPGPDTLFVSSNGQYDGYILKLTANGDFIWVKKFGGIDYDISNAIELDKNGMIYATGAFQQTAYFANATDTITLNSVGYNDVFITKLNNNGDFLWAKAIGSNSDSLITEEGRSIAVDSIGNVYTMGLFKDSLDADPGPAVEWLTAQTFYNSSHSVFILKLDNNGNFIRVKATNGGQDVIGNSIILDNSANVLFTGYFLANSNTGIVDPVDFDPGPAVLPFSVISYAIYIAKWSQCSVGATTLTQTACNSFTWNNETYTESDTYTKTLTTSLGCDSIAVLNLTVLQSIDTSLNINLCYGQTLTVGNNTYNQSGVYQNVLVGSNGCDSTLTTTLFIDTLQAEINITGQSITTINYPTNAMFQWLDCNNNNTPIVGETNAAFTPIIDGNYAVLVSNSNCSDTSDCINYTITGLGLTGIDKFSATIYPNPTNGILSIELSNTLNEGSFTLFDNLGRQILKGSLLQKKTWIDMNNINRGIYHLKILDSFGNQRTFKIIKE